MSEPPPIADRLRRIAVACAALAEELNGVEVHVPGNDNGAILLDGVMPSDLGVREHLVTPVSFSPATPTDDRLPQLAERMLKLRRERERLFGDNLFADPAWDMLLDLFAQRRHGKPVSVSSLCIAAAVPATTALRHMATLEAAGLVVRNAAAHDGRKRYVELTAAAREKISRLLRKAEPLGACL